MGGCCHCEEPGRDPAAGEWVRLGVAGVVAAQSMVFGLAVNLAPPEGVARAVLHGVLAVSAVAVFALAGGRVVRASWEALRRGRVVFDQLFLLGMVAAFAASLHSSLTGVGHVYYEIVAILLAIYTFGGLLTETRRREALDAARDFGTEFDRCVIEAGGGLREVPVRDVRVGSIVRVEAGGPVSVDGEVVEGCSFVEEAALTGEPFPVVRRAGDMVFAGSRAVDGALRVRVAGVRRRLDALLDALREAQARPSRLQRQADRLAAWFLPVVLAVAAGTFAWWTWRVGWTQGLFHALAVILVACPCAMGIATPVAIWSALAALAKLGITARNPDLIEKLASVNAAVFDKTGTLGEEHMELVDLVTAPGVDREALRARAAALEGASCHPIARAFRRTTDRPGEPPQSVEQVPGAGIRGTFPDGILAIGNRDIAGPECHADIAALTAAAATSGATHTVVLTRNGRVEGVAVLRETLRAGAREAIARLDAMRIASEVMTGDSAEAAAAHGLPNLRAGLSPTAKAGLVRDLQQNGRRVLFVGDGINDAAALAGADASLAIEAGSGLARRTADGELAGGNLLSIAEAVERSRAAVRAIRGNLRFAAAYNAIGIALAALGVLHPVAAALLMLVSSFTVTWRALRRPATAARQSLGWFGPAAGAAVFAQGLAICWLGAFQGATAVGLLALFGMAGLAVWWLVSARPRGSPAAVWMFAGGGLAMLAGWWADAGFAPAIRDGVCLCGCADSTFGLGLVGGLSWMDAGMALGSLPMLAVVGRAARWVPWLAGLAGMLVGMRGAAWLSSFVAAGSPQLAFFAGYGAMLFGMALGMLLACGAAARLGRCA